MKLSTRMWLRTIFNYLTFIEKYIVPNLSLLPLSLEVGDYILGWLLMMVRLFAKIKGIEEIVECYIITGDADFLIKIVCQDIPTYEKLLFKTLSQIEEIERLKTLITLSSVKDSKILPYKYD